MLVFFKDCSNFLKEYNKVKVKINVFTNLVTVTWETHQPDIHGVITI